MPASREILTSRLQQSATLSFNTFPMSENGYPLALSPRWVTLVSRTRIAIESGFKPGSSPMRLLALVEHAEKRIVGNAIDRFQIAVNALLELLKKAIEAVRLATYSE